MPVTASIYNLDDAENVAISLFRKFLITLFSKPEFITAKRPGVLEYKITISDVEKISKFRRGLRCDKSHIVDACHAVLTTDDPEAGFLFLQQFPASFIVGIDRKANGTMYRRRRWHRDKKELSEACFYQSAKAVISWKRRLDAALKVIDELDSTNDKNDKKPPTSKSVEQIRFEQVIRDYSRRPR